MMHLIDRNAAAFAVALALAGLVALPSPAISADGSQLAQAQPTQATPPQSAAPPPATAKQPRTRRSAVDRVEAHIKTLHDQLKITATQEPQWDAVAKAMRDDAKAVSALATARRQKIESMTAVDDLRSYQEIADAHAAGVKNLIPPFATLYATMSDAQKKNADTVFRHRPRHGTPKAAKKAD